jgi:hypothetical protein
MTHQRVGNADEGGIAFLMPEMGSGKMILTKVRQGGASGRLHDHLLRTKGAGPSLSGWLAGQDAVAGVAPVCKNGRDAAGRTARAGENRSPVGKTDTSGKKVQNEPDAWVPERTGIEFTGQLKG